MKNKSQTFECSQIKCLKQKINLNKNVIEIFHFIISKQYQCMQSFQDISDCDLPDFEILLKKCPYWIKTFLILLNEI